MEVIAVDNVQQALPEGCRILREKAVRRESRNGAAYVLPTMMTTVYRKPVQRVLFWAERDANPFFHLMESLWILAGHRDVEWIGQFNSKLVQYSDDGVTYNGAYGYRWRHWFGIDQLKMIAENLRKNPNCRRQVLTMWDGGRDLSHQDTKDVPCNLCVPVQIDLDGRLSLAVYNRSNDLIWGAHGANAVQFSVLLEVLAGLIGVPVGTYTQVSMNTHVYEPHWEMARQLADRAPDVVSGQKHTHQDPYAWGAVQAYPMVQNPTTWFDDLGLFMSGATRGFRNPFFSDVAVTIRDCWNVYKTQKGDPNRITAAQDILRPITVLDWGKAAHEWLERRRTP